MTRIAISIGRNSWDRTCAHLWIDADYEKLAVSVCHKRLTIYACAEDECVALGLRLFERLRNDPDADLSELATHRLNPATRALVAL
jgi:hypothetical protein